MKPFLSPCLKPLLFLTVAMIVTACQQSQKETRGPNSTPIPGELSAPGIPEPVDPSIFPAEEASDTEIWIIETPGTPAIREATTAPQQGIEDVVVTAKLARGSAMEEVVVLGTRRASAMEEVPLVRETPWYKDHPPESASLARIFHQ